MPQVKKFKFWRFWKGIYVDMSCRLWHIYIWGPSYLTLNFSIPVFGYLHQRTNRSNSHSEHKKTFTKLRWGDRYIISTSSKKNIWHSFIFVSTPSRRLHKIVFAAIISYQSNYIEVAKFSSFLVFCCVRRDCNNSCETNVMNFRVQ